MSQQFNRIKRDLNKFGGQAYIQNTDITVNQILSTSIQGASIEDMLAKFPLLSVEDIYEALTFAIHDLFKGMSYWRHDGMTPLTQIKGYSEILVGKTEFDDLDTIPDSKKHEWMSIIHASSQRGIARWQQMSQWISKQYNPPDIHPNLDIYQIEEFIRDIVTIAQNYEPSLQISIIPFDLQIDIEVHNDVALILGSILAFAKNTFKSQTTIDLEISNKYVYLHICRELIYHDDDVQKLLNIPYSPIATAYTFFYTQNLQFNIQRDEDMIIFSIQLPIWTQ